ncbi:hypothetical protein GCM10007111_33140 [Virgibacillus kapii]|uniref:Uncharacterized protein n=2 Tax=Virgibacillus TaxID=84406 RepID=A0A024QF80_9BACI|nr:hypothetical protein GCM10007111_33140 [Virgibacillus kapii]CDQ40606.1 hypothetical protein BN990_02932 [Virgibacillus massiliensis]
MKLPSLKKVMILSWSLILLTFSLYECKTTDIASYEDNIEKAQEKDISLCGW